MTVSPSCTARPSTGASSATDERRSSSSRSTSSSGTSASGFGTSSVFQSGSSGFGWTSTVAENVHASLSLFGSSKS